MAKQVLQVENPCIICKEYKGLLKDMPEEAKDRLIERNPKAEQLFKNWVAPEPIISE